jgi:hypothetical protein
VVLNLQRVLGLYVVRADVRVALETLICEGRKRILGSAFNFFYRSCRLRVPICADFFLRQPITGGYFEGLPPLRVLLDML